MTPVLIPIIAHGFQQIPPAKFHLQSKNFMKKFQNSHAPINTLIFHLHPPTLSQQWFFAFQCHASVLPIYSELKQPSKQKMQYVSTISIGLVFIMYLLASLFGYLTFKNVTGPELFVMYSGYMPDDKLILVGRLMVLICVIFSAPLLHFPCRKAFIVQVWGPEKMPQGNDFRWSIWLGSMFGILTMVVLLVIYVPNIKEVFGLAGASVATMLVIIMPAGFYYLLGPEEKTSMKKRINLVVVGFGVVFAIFSTGLIIYGWFHPHTLEEPCRKLLDSIIS